MTTSHVRAGLGWLLAAGLCWGTGCSADAEGSPTPAESPGGGGSSSDGGSGGATGGSGAGSETGPGVTSWIVGTWLTDPDGEYTGLLTVVDDLSDDGNLDLDNATEWPTDFMYTSPGSGVVFVGRDDRPNIERWELNDDGALENTADPPLGLSDYGVTSTLGRSQPVVQFIDEDRAYYIDIENFQVIVFNPSTTPMTIYPNDTFSFDGLDVEGEWEDIGMVRRDGDRIILTGRYWDENDDTTTPLVRAAVIDVTSDSVTYAEDSRCANIGSTVVDDEGNIYFGSHPGLAVSTAYGGNDDDTPAACIIRMKKGENEFDPDYLVNLEDISSGGVVGSLQQGVNNHAYVLQYTGDAEITAENWRSIMLSAEWEAHVFELGDAENGYTKLEGFPKGGAYGSSFRTTVGHEEVTYLVWSDPDGGGRYYDVSSPTSAVAGLEFSGGYPGRAIAVE